MKKLLFLMLFPVIAFAQIGDAGDNIYGPLQTGGFNSGTVIFNKAYVAATIDTTEWITTTGFQTVELHLWTKDSATVLVTVQGSPFPQAGASIALPFEATLVDSLDSGSGGSGAHHVVITNFNVTAAGATVTGVFYPYMRFLLDFDENVRPVGSTTATYYAFILLRR